VSTISRYIFKETVKTQFTIFTVLMVIFMSQTFIRFVSRAVKGSIPTELVAELLSLSIPTMANFMLPLSLFLAVLFSIGSFCSQSEMVVMRSVGYSRSRLLSLVFILAFVTASVNALCTLVLAPWCEAKQVDIINQAKSDPSFMSFESGRFITLMDSTIYIDDLASDNKKNENYIKEGLNAKSAKQIYIFQRENQARNISSSVTLSQEGIVSYDEDDVMWLTLNNGTSYEVSTTDNDENMRITNFGTYNVLVPEVEEGSSKEKASTKSTKQLIEDKTPNNVAELQWRIVQPLSIFVLVLLVVPLSMVNPRQGRFAKFIPAIAIYISYYLFAFGLKSTIARGNFFEFPGIFILPIAYAVIFTIPFNITDTEWYRRFKAKKEQGAKENV
jgi:lipopolysaccharide export system permease protein